MRILALIFFGFLIDTAIWTQALPAPAGNSLHFLDVGQGDAQLLTVSEGVQILVDTGPSAAVVRELEEVLGPEDRYIDLVVLTHAEKDHFGGLPSLLEKYEIGALIWNGRCIDDEHSDWYALEKKIRARRIPLLRVRKGDRIRIGGTKIEILAPDLGLLGSGKLNDGSIVQKVTLGDATVLLTGDAGFASEDGLSISADDVDVLKIGHHGSKFSSSQTFLASVRPEISVIQVGARNTYGHPAPEVLRRIEETVSSTILRNDRNGRIELRFEPLGIRVFTER